MPMWKDSSGTRGAKGGEAANLRHVRRSIRIGRGLRDVNEHGMRWLRHGDGDATKEWQCFFSRGGGDVCFGGMDLFFVQVIAGLFTDQEMQLSVFKVGDAGQVGSSGSSSYASKCVGTISFQEL